MAIVTAFIRVSTTKKKEANVRFRLRDGRAVQLLYSSELKVKPEHWNPKREEIKAKVLIDPVDRAEFNRNVNNLKALIMDLYNAAPDKSALTSDWLKAEMQKKLVSRSVCVNISLYMTRFLKLVLQSSAIRIPLTIFLPSFAHSSVGQWKAVKHRIIRSLISQFRNVFMVRHTTLLLKKGISYIIPILIITQP